MPDPQREHLRIENILQWKGQKLPLSRASKKCPWAHDAIERKTDNRKCHLPQCSESQQWKWCRKIGVSSLTISPKSNYFPSSISFMLCLFAHNYDSPERKQTRLPKNRSTNETKPQPNITQWETTVVITFYDQFIWWPDGSSPFRLPSTLPSRLDASISERISFSRLFSMSDWMRLFCLNVIKDSPRNQLVHNG